MGLWTCLETWIAKTQQIRTDSFLGLKKNRNHLFEVVPLPEPNIAPESFKDEFPFGAFRPILRGYDVLDGGFNIFYFHPYLGKIPILTNIFSDGLKPPTSVSFRVGYFHASATGWFYVETNCIETSSWASGWSDQDFDHLKGSFWCEDACLHVESRGLLVGWFGWLVSCKIAGFPMYSPGLEVTTNYGFCHIFFFGNYISISRNDKLFI